MDPELQRLEQAVEEAKRKLAAGGPMNASANQAALSQAKSALDSYRQTSPTKTEHGDQLRAESQRGLEEARKLEAPMADTSREDQFRGQQTGLANQLMRVSMGQEAGAGELAARRAGARAQAAQIGMARAGGPNAAMAARRAQRNAADIGLQTSGQAQQAAMQDQAAARGQLANVLQSGRGLDQKTSLANQAAQLQTQGLSQQMALAYLAQLYGVDQSEMNARLQMEIAQMNKPGGLGWGDVLSTAGQIGSAYLMKPSDRRLKTEIKDGGGKLAEFLGAIDPYEYDYKDAKHGKGKHVSVMAQDLERSSLGRDLVIETPEGKFVDYGKGLATMLAGVAYNNRRLEALEKGKKS